MGLDRNNVVLRRPARCGPAPSVEVRRVDGLSDRELLGRFLDRADQTAFDVLVRRHGPMVLRVCQRVLHNVHDREDAFQATFIVLMRKAGSIANQESLASWLHGTACRVALNARTSASRRRTREQLAVDSLAPNQAAASTEAAAAWRDLRPVLDEELARLPEKYRAPMVLCYLEGKTTADTAGQLGMNPGAVAMRLSRARDLLRDRLARRGVALSVAVFASWLAEEASAAATTDPASLAAAQQAATSAGANAVFLADGLKEPTEAAFGSLARRVVLLAAGALVLATGLYVAFPHAADDWRTLPGHTQPVTALAFTPDGGALVTRDVGGTIRVWDPTTGNATQSFAVAAEPLAGLVVAPDGKLVAVESADGRGGYQVELRNPVTGASVASFVKGLQTHPGLRFTNDGRQVVWAQPLAGLQAWDRNTATTRTIVPEAAVGISVALSPDGAVWAVGSVSGALQLFDARTGRLQTDLLRPRGPDSVDGVEFSPNGRMLVSTHMEMVVRVWDVAARRLLATFPRPGGGPTRCLAFTGDSTCLALVDPPAVRFHAASDGRELARVAPAGWEPVSAIALSPDGRWIAVATGTHVRLARWPDVRASWHIP